jgi:MraZ protein
MLLGEYRCTAEGETLTIPAEFCVELGEGLALTRGIERCLLVYPVEEWRTLVDKMRKRLSLTNPDARAFARLIFSAAVTCAPDQQGQVPLPNDLRQYADIEDEVVLVGLCTYMEVWNPQRWQQVQEQMIERRSTVAESLSRLGI